MSHKGIHHITAIAGDPQENYEFYTQKLGLRMVKKTVNYDDPSVYHLYYGNEQGEPGTILSFFPSATFQEGEPDVGQAVAVSFAIPAGSKSFWLHYLQEQKIDFEAPFERFGKEIIGLQDPNGLHLELVMDPAAEYTSGWEDSPLPTRHTIRGLHGITLAEEHYYGTGQLLEEDLGFELTGQEENRYQYQSKAEFGSVVEVIDQFPLNGSPGSGTIHHVAFRVEDEEEQQELRKKLLNKGYHLTEVKDRGYFKSIYFHEPGGILFEIATDPPGFTHDETLSNLGNTLQLPEWLEEDRDFIERDLSNLTS